MAVNIGAAFFLLDWCQNAPYISIHRQESFFFLWCRGATSLGPSVLFSHDAMDVGFRAIHCVYV